MRFVHICRAGRCSIPSRLPPQTRRGTFVPARQYTLCCNIMQAFFLNIYVICWTKVQKTIWQFQSMRRTGGLSSDEMKFFAWKYAIHGMTKGSIMFEDLKENLERFEETSRRWGWCQSMSSRAVRRNTLNSKVGRAWTVTLQVKIFEKLP